MRLDYAMTPKATGPCSAVPFFMMTSLFLRRREVLWAAGSRDPEAQEKHNCLRFLCERLYVIRPYAIRAYVIIRRFAVLAGDGSQLRDDAQGHSALLDEGGVEPLVGD